LAGLRYVVGTQRNAQIQLAVAVLVILVALALDLELRDWAVLVLTMGAVLAAEVGNTVVEATVDLASPQHSALAKTAKDAASGAVLLLALVSVIVGLLILGPPLYWRLFG
jgi:undecaprenol kinase/diacylglycerol kinase (ATP)